MGDYDFLSSLDLGDLGGGVASGANTFGAGMPDVSGMTFDIPNYSFPSFGDGGVMSGVNIPNLPQVGQMQQPQMPQQPLAPGAGVTLDPRGGGAPPPQPDQGFNLGQILKPAQGPLQALTGIAGLGLSGLGIKNALEAGQNAREQAGIQRGFQRNQQQLQQQQQQSVQPLQQFGTQQLGRASAGQVDPAVQMYIDQWAQAQKVKMQQQMASMGITNSTMMQSALGQIDQQALAMKAQILGMDKNTAIQALQSAMGGTASAMGGAQSGAMVANVEQNQLDNLIRSSQQALAQLNAMAG